MSGRRNLEYDSDDELYEKLKRPASILDDLITAIYEVRLTAPFVVLFAALAAYQLLIAPYRIEVDRPDPASIDLYKLRPLLTKEQQIQIRETVFYAETSIWLPNPPHDVVSFRFHPSGNRHGAYNLPDFFYEGAVFSLTTKNSFNLEFTGLSHLPIQVMREDLLQMIPKPTHIMRRVSQNNVTEWHEEGIAVYYKYSDLELQGKLSSDTEKPYKRVLPQILALARKFKLVYVTVYYPHSFGQVKSSDSNANTNANAAKSVPSESGKVSIDTSSTANDNEKRDKKISKNMYNKASSNNYQYTNIIQEIVPTRTGLNYIKASSVVWLSKVNANDPHLSDADFLASIVYKKEWNGELKQISP